MFKKMHRKYVFIMILAFNSVQASFTPSQAVTLTFMGCAAINSIVYSIKPSNKNYALCSKIAKCTNVIGWLSITALTVEQVSSGFWEEVKTTDCIMSALAALSYCVYKEQKLIGEKAMQKLRRDNSEIKAAKRYYEQELQELYVTLSNQNIPDSVKTQLEETNKYMARVLKNILVNLQESCVVCLEDFSDKQEIGMYKCGHWVCPCYKESSPYETDIFEKCPHCRNNAAVVTVPLS